MNVVKLYKIEYKVDGKSTTVYCEENDFLIDPLSTIITIRNAFQQQSKVKPMFHELDMIEYDYYKKIVYETLVIKDWVAWGVVNFDEKDLDWEWLKITKEWIEEKNKFLREKHEENLKERMIYYSQPKRPTEEIVDESGMSWFEAVVKFMKKSR